MEIVPTMRSRTTARRRRRQSPDEVAGYVIVIDRWSAYWGHHLSLGRRRERGPTGTNETLEFRGRVFRPDGFRYPDAEVGFQRMDEPVVEDPPVSIGLLTLGTGKLRATVFLEPDPLRDLAILASSNRIAVIHLAASALRYRKALITGVEVFTEFVPEDW